MNIQSLSVVVPSKGCVQDCPFCVSKMHKSQYELAHRNSKILKSLKDRLEFSRDNGCNIMMITGTGEPLQSQTNVEFIDSIIELNNELFSPFKWVELQTTGYKVLDHLQHLDYWGVKTVSLSISDLFDEENNSRILRTPEKYSFKFSDVSKKVKEMGINVRLSLNLTKLYYDIDLDQIVDTCKSVGADQITLRQLYHGDEDGTPQTEWVLKNYLPTDWARILREQLDERAMLLEPLPTGESRHSYKGLSIVYDYDCMAKDLNRQKEIIRYLILRPNGKLFTKWDDPASLLF